MPDKLKRILTDTAGYLLIVAGIALGWLPGPGGLPLVLAGLGLLSINNDWARRLRDYIVKNGGEYLKKLFPDNKYIQAAYDLIAILLVLLVAALIWGQRPMWQVMLASICFFIALVIAGMNRDRLTRIKSSVSKN